MFSFGSNKRVLKYIDDARAYIQKTFEEPEKEPLEEPGIESEETKEAEWLNLLDIDGGYPFGSSEDIPDTAEYKEGEEPCYSLPEVDEPRYSLPVDESEVQYSLREYRDEADISDPDKTPKASGQQADQGIKYSLNVPRSDAKEDISTTMRSMIKTGDYKDINPLLDKAIDQTFVEQMIELIREKGLRDSKVYKAAQIDRRLYSKIMSDMYYKPSKDTALALSYALELSVDQAKDLLSKAGYSLSHSDKRDIIIEFFFKERIFNILEINCVLENLGQKIIGR